MRIVVFVALVLFAFPLFAQKQKGRPSGELSDETCAVILSDHGLGGIESFEDFLAWLAKRLEGKHPEVVEHEIVEWMGNLTIANLFFSDEAIAGKKANKAANLALEHYFYEELPGNEGITNIRRAFPLLFAGDRGAAIAERWEFLRRHGYSVWLANDRKAAPGWIDAKDRTIYINTGAVVKLSHRLRSTRHAYHPALTFFMEMNDAMFIVNSTVADEQKVNNHFLHDAIRIREQMAMIANPGGLFGLFGDRVREAIRAGLPGGDPEYFFRQRIEPNDFVNHFWTFIRERESMRVGYRLFGELRRAGVPFLFAPFEVMAYAEGRSAQMFRLAELNYLDGYGLPREFTSGLEAAIPSYYPERWFVVTGPEGVTPLRPGFH